MKQLRVLVCALLLITTATSVSAKQIIREDIPVDNTVYTATEGSGSCGDNLTWSVDKSGSLHISGSGSMYDFTAPIPINVEGVEYSERDYIPWYNNNEYGAITSVYFDDGITEIADCAIMNSHIKRVIIPNSVTKIGRGAFAATKLTGLVLPDTMTSLTKSFSGNFDLTYLHLPYNLKKTEDDVFGWSYALKNVYLPNSLEEIGFGTFYSCMSLDNIILPDSLKKINSSAFAFCDSLKNISFSAGLKEIDEYAFSGCFSLTDICLPDGLEKIGYGAFGYDTDDRDPSAGVQTAYVPKSAQIEDYAFNQETVIYGFEGSSAESYAKEHGNKFVAVTESMYKAPDNSNNNIDVFSDGRNINVSVAGKNVIWTDAKPFIDQNERIQLPIRTVAESIGCKVDWDDKSATATIVKDNTVITITADKAEMKVNDKAVTMDTAAQIIDGRTYIPLRFVGEALGMQVNWI